MVLQNGDYIKSFIIIHGSVSNSITQPVATDLHKKEQYQPNIGIKCNRFVTKRMRYNISNTSVVQVRNRAQ